MKRLFPFLALALLWHPAFATVTLVQVAHASTSSLNHCAVTLNSVAANDTLIFFSGINANTTFTSIADSSGNTVSAAESWTANASSPAWGFGMYYVQAASAGTHTITITVGTAANNTCFMAEYSGLATTGVFDKGATVSFGSNLSTVTSNSITPTASGELLIFGFVQAGTGLTYSGYNNIFVQKDTTTSVPSGAWASEIQVTASAINGSVSSSTTGSYGAGLAAFVPAASGSTCTHSGLTSGGAISVPTAGSTVVRLKNGTFGTVDCSTTSYFQPTLGNFGVN